MIDWLDSITEHTINWTQNSVPQISMDNSHLFFQLAYSNTHWRCDIIMPADRILTHEVSIYTCI